MTFQMLRLVNCNFIQKVGSYGLALLLFLALSSHRSPGQVGSASLSGTVVDRSGALVPDAQVKVVSEDTNAIFETKTNRAGVYNIPALKPGSYRIDVVKQGFKQIEIRDIMLNTQDSVNRNFTLDVGASSETITVNAAGGMVPISDSPAVGVLVSHDFVENMPLNGRSFQDLIALAPGTVDAGGLFSVNGQRFDANYFTVDGVAANTGSSALAGGNPGGLAGVLPEQTVVGTTQSLTSVDALEEFKVETSGYTAEKGRQPGGQIQLTTRSGTNDLHGSLYDFLRNEAFDANSWESNFQGIPRQQERQNDFGGTVGGPLRVPRLYDGKDKTFYFVSYEGLRLKLPASAAESVPTVAFRQFASPAYQPFLNAFPLPNGPNNADPCLASFNPSFAFPCTALWRSGFSNPNSIDSTSLRLDQIVRTHLQLFVHYSNTSSAATTRDGLHTGSDEETLSQNNHSWTVGTTWRLSGTLVDELRFNYAANAGSSLGTMGSIGGAVPYPASLLVPSKYAPPGTPTQVNVYFELQGPFPEFFEAPRLFQTGAGVHQYNLVNSIGWAHGRHNFKFGGDFRRLKDEYNANPSYGVSVFSTSAQTLQQGIAGFLGTLAAIRAHPTFTNLSLYSQDSWKATSHLTLDYGVRWEFNPPPGASDGIYPLALTTGNLPTAELARAGTAQYRTQYRAFAPRIGFAMQLNNSTAHALALRGGFGVFYDTAQNLGAAGYSGYPYSTFQFMPNVALPAPVNLLAPPNLNAPLVPPYGTNLSLNLNDPHLSLPYTEQWNLSLNQGLTSRNTLTVSYVGNGGKKLLFTEYYADLSAINPLFSQLQLTSNAASSTYNALQVQDQGFLAPGMQVIGSYTWAHAIDNSSNGAYNNLPPTRGNSDNDVRQVFNIALNYNVPGATSNAFLRGLTRGWGLDERFTAYTGYPVIVFQSRYFISPGQILATVFPDLNRGVPLVLRNVPGDPFGWALNPAAFSPVPLNPDGSPLHQGDLPRNYVHGPGFWNLNSAAQREFQITERLRLIFRVEAFNIFNHPNAAAPDGCLCDIGNGFGKIGTLGYTHTIGAANPLYASGSARSLQINLKLRF